MNKAQRETLTRDWPATIDHVRQQFPDLTDGDVRTTDPDKLVKTIRERTGSTKQSVEATMTRIAQRLEA